MTLLDWIVAPIVIPTSFALSVIDTLVFQDRTNFGHDLYAGAQNVLDDVAGRPRVYGDCDQR